MCYHYCMERCELSVRRIMAVIICISLQLIQFSYRVIADDSFSKQAEKTVIDISWDSGYYSYITY